MTQQQNNNEALREAIRAFDELPVNSENTLTYAQQALISDAAKAYADLPEKIRKLKQYPNTSPLDSLDTPGDRDFMECHNQALDDILNMLKSFDSSDLSETQRVMDLMADCIQDAITGIKWWMAEYPHDDNKADEEKIQEWENVLLQYEKLAGVE